ncbi:hypothetical protein LNQ52_12455 [Klebsiella pneumoniae subsp. pneumoniae]|nr:hypothetical protein [Klebsiella pneumoniae subsp. pneumoniae]
MDLDPRLSLVKFTVRRSPLPQACCWPGSAANSPAAKKGFPTSRFFSGIALMGGGMFRDFAIIATAFGVKLDELKKRASRARWRWSSPPCSPFTWERLSPGPSAIPMRSAWRLSAAAR